MKLVTQFCFFGSTLLIATLVFVGCASEQEVAELSETDTTQASTVVDDHSGWWCPEHGIPEKDCTMCSSKAAKKHKENGDWCDEHNRAESQCFICEPSQAEKFAKLYEAKYGKLPPAIAE